MGHFPKIIIARYYSVSYKAKSHGGSKFSHFRDDAVVRSLSSGSGNHIIYAKYLYELTIFKSFLTFDI